MSFREAGRVKVTGRTRSDKRGDSLSSEGLKWGEGADTDYKEGRRGGVRAWARQAYVAKGDGVLGCNERLCWRSETGGRLYIRGTRAERL